MWLRIVTAVAALVSAVVHLVLWVDGYRDIDVIGPAFLVNAVAGVIYSLTMPLVAITTAYVYFDRRVATELAVEREPAQLPAEIELSP